MLEVIRDIPSFDGHAQCECRCDCGKTLTVPAYDLRRAAKKQVGRSTVKSCGCVRYVKVKPQGAA
jgi:hypothetical protein